MEALVLAFGEIGNLLQTVYKQEGRIRIFAEAEARTVQSLVAKDTGSCAMPLDRLVWPGIDVFLILRGRDLKPDDPRFWHRIMRVQGQNHT